MAAQRSAGNHVVTRLVQRTVLDADAFARQRGLQPPDEVDLASWVDQVQAVREAGDHDWEPLLRALLRDLPFEDAHYVLTRMEYGLTDEEFHTEPEDGDEAEDYDGADFQDAQSDSDFGSDDEGQMEPFDIPLPGPEAYLESDDEDEYLDPGTPKSKKRPRNTRPRKPLPDVNTAMTTFKEKGESAPKRRRTEPVTGTLETIQHVSGRVIQRPTSVTGIVEPGATAGRPSAPEPVNIRVGVKWAQVGGDSRDTGIVDAQKGHLMALELGGPDLPWNIVPQWANYQANGAWRRAEKRVYDLAVDAGSRGRQLVMRVDVHYKSYEFPEQGTLKGLSVPSGFTVTVTEQDVGGANPAQGVIAYDGEQYQDATDFRVAEKVISSLDGPAMDVGDQ